MRNQRGPRTWLAEASQGMTVTELGEIGATASSIAAQVRKGRLELDRPAGLLELRDLLGEEQPPRPGVRRPCITCGTLFLSTGPGHRMCERCRRIATEYA